MLKIILTVALLFANWFIFKKMGREGWEGIIPLYNSYVMSDILFGSGFKFLLMLVPIYNIYFYFKWNIELAKAFNKEAGFGFGLALLPNVFTLILGLDRSIVFRDGTQSNNDEDFVNRTANVIKGTVTNIATEVSDNAKEKDAIEKLKKLKELLDDGIITEEEYNEKKSKLIDEI